MIAVYLIMIWFLLTVFWSGNRRLRGSAPVFLLWFALTAVMLWPVTRRLYESPQLREIGAEVSREWQTELEKEFGEEFEKVVSQ